jgi:lysophospholipase L1-like esterase
METFRTVIQPVKAVFEISHKHKIMLMGSCFSENIGSFLLSQKFNVDQNPFGIIFNPSSIKKSFEILLSGQLFSEKQLFYNNEQWHSFHHHSRFSNADRTQCLNNINNRIDYSSQFLKDADYIILTLGTSHIFKLSETGEVVSNCHKLPSPYFIDEFLTSQQIVSDYKELIRQIRQVNPDVKIIFTVSPVRHLKEGAAGNQLSKAILLVAVHELCKITGVYYFPAYELVLDDLRDYRFYDTDMVHPSAMAVDYIWEFFSKTYFSEATQILNKDIEKINSAFNHKPINTKSES